MAEIIIIKLILLANLLKVKVVIRAGKPIAKGMLMIFEPTKFPNAIIWLFLKARRVIKVSGKAVIKAMKTAPTAIPDNLSFWAKFKLESTTKWLPRPKIIIPKIKIITGKISTIFLKMPYKLPLYSSKQSCQGKTAQQY